MLKVAVAIADYQPSGKIAAAGLYSPEAQLMSAPLTVGLLNALHSTVDNGLSACEGGFGYRGAIGQDNCNWGSAGRRASAEGLLTLPLPAVPTAASIVDQLDLLLTGGRLSAAIKAYIMESVGVAHFGVMYMVAHETGSANPVTDEISTQGSMCMSAKDFHDVACCSGVQSGHGDMNYGRGSRFASCAEVTEPLFGGSWVLDGVTDSTGATCTNNECRNQACINDVEFSSAEAYCAADNARLCTQAEVEGSCLAYNGCGNRYLWTSTPCTVDEAEEAQRLAAKLILGTAEFRTLSDNRLGTTPRAGKKSHKSNMEGRFLSN